MCKKTLLLTAALVSSFGAVAQALPDGTTSLLPAGVTANIGQEKMFVKQKNLCVAGSPSKGYKAYFSATDADHGEELWVTDGTPTGTHMVKDINPGVATSDIQWLTRFNDKVVFSAKDDEDNGSELWISDGTEAGTYMIKDIHDFGSSNPIAFCQMDETHFVFFATDGESEFAASTPQRWLWISDGTEEYPIDIVVSDVMMPEMDGIELCDRLKNNLATSHIPVILLTAKSDEESTMAGFKSGAEAYVAKPFDPQLLALRVKNILRARRAYIDLKIEDSSVDEPIEELPPLNKFDNEFITRINQLIDDNMDNSEFSIADITRELAISRSLLHIKMKTFFNSSMTDYIKQRRMAKACELLKKGYNVSETAYRAGFSDPNYFSKVFRKTFGMSPSDFISASPSE